MNLTVLISCSVDCPLIWVFLMFPRDWSYAFFCRNTAEGLSCSSQGIIPGGTWLVFVPLLVLLSLITWFGYCLPRFSIVMLPFFPEELIICRKVFWDYVNILFLIEFSSLASSDDSLLLLFKFLLASHSIFSRQTNNNLLCRKHFVIVWAVLLKCIFCCNNLIYQNAVRIW